MSSFEPAADLLRRLGAVPAEDVVRYLVGACEALAAAGPGATVTLDTLEVGEKVRLSPRPFTTPPADPGRAQVRAVAALGYELLKGMPPPAQASERDWLGERPELVNLLAPALAGTGAADVNALAHQLRTLARPNTAAYVAPKLADTVQSSQPQALPTTERAGEVLGAYELVRRLGSGGMGDVYLARHVRLGREVAVKLLKPEFAAQPEIVQRFFQEAKVVNEINHPHIVEIHDFVEEPGRGVYCVMELLQGHSLADLLTQGTLEVRRAARLFAQACDALEAAHRRGVVHRDVKPDNLFVSEGDFVRVLDFGIARRLSPGQSRTQVGLVLGTPYYMAPEQAAGRAVDARADLYSVGVALFEALTGAAPQQNELILHTRKGEPVPEALSRLLQRCLSLDPAQRPASAAEVRDALLAISGAPVPPRPTTDAIEAAAGLRPALRGVGAFGAVVVLGAIAFIALWPTDGGERPVPAAVPTVVSPPAGALVVKPPPPAEVTASPEPAVKPPSEAGDVKTPPEAVVKSSEAGDAKAPAEALLVKPSPEAADVKSPPETVVKSPEAGAVKTPPQAAVVKPSPEAADVKPAVATTTPSRKLKRPPPPVVAKSNPFAPRADAVRRRYDALLSRFGAGQLTSLEKAAVAQALDDFSLDRQSDLPQSLASAEAALDAADKRLSR